MKLAIVTSGLFSYTGGPPVVIANLINELAEFNELEISYFGVDGDIHPNMKKLAKNVDVKNFEIKTPYRFSSSYFKTLIKKSPDVVWVHGLWLWPNFAGIMYSLLYGKKLLVTPHGVLTKEMFSRKWYKKISIGLPENLVLMCKKNVKIHYLSLAEKKSCVLKKINIKNQIIPNYVNASVDVSVSRDRDFLFLARIAPIKGIEDILAIQDFKCDIYGFGDQNYINKTVLKNPNYFGAVNNSVVNTIFSKYKFYVLPSYGEGLPTSAIEAAMCGCVLIVSNQCNLNMFTHNVDAIKFDAGKDNLQNAIEIAKNLSDQKIAEFRENAQNTIKNRFSKEILNENYKKFIKQW